MKVFNAIVLYDVYVVAESNEAAREAAEAWIHEGLQPSESKAMEVREVRQIRESWKDKKPLVGADISDEDFEKRVKGNTTADVFNRIYTKRG